MGVVTEMLVPTAEQVSAEADGAAASRLKGQPSGRLDAGCFAGRAEERRALRRVSAIRPKHQPTRGLAGLPLRPVVLARPRVRQQTCERGHRVHARQVAAVSAAVAFAIGEQKRGEKGLGAHALIVRCATDRWRFCFVIGQVLDAALATDTASSGSAMSSPTGLCAAGCCGRTTGMR